MLGVLAQPDAAGVRADRNAELRGEEKNRQHLVDSPQPATVELADIDRLELEELLEYDAVLDVLAGRDPEGCDCGADSQMPDDIVRACRLLDPPRIDLGKAFDGMDRLLDSPSLICVQREQTLGADRVADESRPS